MAALEAIDTWPATTVAAGWLRPDDAPTRTGTELAQGPTTGPVGRGGNGTPEQPDVGPGWTGRQRGPVDARLPLASVTKPMVAYAVLVAVEEGSLSLDEAAGPEGSTVRHLLSHSSGLSPDSDDPLTASRVGSRRIYSNHGFETLGRALEQGTGIDVTTYLREAVLEPLGMTATSLEGSPAHGAVGSLADLLRFGAELLRPTLVHPDTVTLARTAHLGALDGVLPGFGRQTPNPWGLGFEIRGHKSPHWTGSTNSPSTFGHFGRSGCFLWVDPVLDGCAAVVTDKPFGPWAAQAWPLFNDAVVAELADPAGLGRPEAPPPPQHRQPAG